MIIADTRIQQVMAGGRLRGETRAVLLFVGGVAIHAREAMP
jgi:hypothetical protein